MITTPMRKIATPITSGGPKPNQAVPVEDASGSLRSMTERISSQNSRIAPTTGPTPMSSRFFRLCRSCRR